MPFDFLSVFCYLYIVILLKFEFSQDSSYVKAKVDCYGAFFNTHSCFLLVSWPGNYKGCYVCHNTKELLVKFVHFSKTLPSSGPQGIKDDHIAHMLYLWHNNVVHPFNKCGLHCKNSKS